MGKSGASPPVTIDRMKSAERIERDIETLAGADYTRFSDAIRRYAYTAEYRKTLDYFIGELQALGFEHYEDPVSTLVARNCPAGESGRLVAALEEAAEASGEPYMMMHSGAAHDTMSIADRVSSAMVFVPRKDGISHSPEKDVNPADAALGAEIMLNAISTLAADEKREHGSHHESLVMLRRKGCKQQMPVLIEGGQIIMDNDELVGKPGDGNFVKRARFGEKLPGTSRQRPLIEIGENSLRREPSAESSTGACKP